MVGEAEFLGTHAQPRLRKSHRMVAPEFKVSAKLRELIAEHNRNPQATA
jgi:hypothetical protein